MGKNTLVSRRQFIQRSGSALALCLAAGTAPAFGGLRANEKVNLGFIGVGDRNRFHLRHFGHMPDVRVAALCDVDRSQLDAAAARLDSKTARFKDFRKLLEMKEIDAVVIGTPDHWHAIITITACEAGKDVYVEKPLGQNIREGRAVVQAVQEHNRVVAVGTQQRSGVHFVEAVDAIRRGELGKISSVRCWNAWGLQDIQSGSIEGIGNPPDSAPPADVDYDMWLGPAPLRPFNSNRFHRNFYYFWDYAGGMISGWGVHLFDVVLWAMGNNFHEVNTTGGIYVYRDNRETPDTAEVVFTCPNYVLTYSLRQANSRPVTSDMDHGIEFYGTEASLFINRREYRIYTEDAPTEPVMVDGAPMEIPHKENFIDCVRSRQKPHADVETGHLASIPGHLANISYRVGRPIRWDAENETILNDEEASDMLGRVCRPPWHL